MTIDRGALDRYIEREEPAEWFEESDDPATTAGRVLSEGDWDYGRMVYDHLGGIGYFFADGRRVPWGELTLASQDCIIRAANAVRDAVLADVERVLAAADMIVAVYPVEEAVEIAVARYRDVRTSLPPDTVAGQVLSAADRERLIATINQSWADWADEEDRRDEGLPGWADTGSLAEMSRRFCERIADAILADAPHQRAAAIERLLAIERAAREVIERTPWRRMTEPEMERMERLVDALALPTDPRPVAGDAPLREQVERLRAVARLVHKDQIDGGLDVIESGSLLNAIYALTEDDLGITEDDLDGDAAGEESYD